jgi:predicted MPP superfamily phosphohydrolase
LFLGIIITSYAFAHAAADPSIVHVDVPLSRLPRSFDGFRVCVMADLHASTTVSRRQISTAVELCLAQRPDLVALVGDLMDGPRERLAPSLEPLARLTTTTHGVYWVNGNHLFISGQPAAWTQHIVSQLNVTALRNRRVLIRNSANDTFWLAGVDDWSADGSAAHDGFRADPARALARDSDDQREVVFLAHQSKHVDDGKLLRD